jgi:hypothetical protein
MNPVNIQCLLKLFNLWLIYMCRRRHFQIFLKIAIQDTLKSISIYLLLPVFQTGLRLSSWVYFYFIFKLFQYCWKLWSINGTNGTCSLNFRTPAPQGLKCRSKIDPVLSPYTSQGVIRHVVPRIFKRTCFFFLIIRLTQTGNCLSSWICLCQK